MNTTRGLAHEALDELLDLGGLSRGLGDNVTLTGDDPVLPTRYRIGTAGAAVLAATGVAASELWRLKTGRRQDVSVDIPAAAISLRSGKYMQINGVPADREFAPLMKFYPAKDGRWVFLHTNFTNLRDQALRILGVPDDYNAVKEAISGWDGEALETALHEGGAVGSFVRTHGEWNRHPHAAFVAGLPAVDIVRIGDAPPRPLPAGDRPLSGIRVLDLTRVIAGPTASRTMAEHGADVLKITRVGLADSGQMDLDTGIGKLSARLDLREKDQHAKLRELVSTCDVFTQSYRPGTLAGRGFGPEELAALHPGMIYVTLSAWGHEGPWRSRRGYDTVVQAATGMADASRDETGPKHLPVSAIDYVGGNLLAYGAMVALARRATEGGSWLVRASLAGAGKWIVDRGVLPRFAYESAPADLPEDQIARLCTEVDMPLGRMRYLAPIVRMSETPARWARPPVPLGHSPAAWPA
jgi:crotonobetainyl-CoA:carnitine CoA-transferase CaiB-like acyl-CoA transferase